MAAAKKTVAKPSLTPCGPFFYVVGNKMYGEGPAKQELFGPFPTIQAAAEHYDACFGINEDEDIITVFTDRTKVALTRNVKINYKKI